MRGTQDEAVVDPEIVSSTKKELATKVENLLDCGVLAIPFLSWDPESRDMRERVAIRRIGTIFVSYQVHTWYWGKSILSCGFHCLDYCRIKRVHSQAGSAIHSY
jgi:hypothetical protein